MGTPTLPLEPNKVMNKQSTYRAWVIKEAGGRFETAQYEMRALEANRVLVRISASGINPLDTKIRAAKAEHAQQPLPAVLGVDMAGVVEEIGSAVNKFRVGDEVYGMVGGVGGHQGTLAEFVAADANLLAHKPANLSMLDAAVLPLSIITAWEGLVDRAQVRSGQTVLVHAGAGGIGYITTQIALAFGAQVFATVSPDKAGIVKALGATPIDYRSVPVTEYISSSTGGLGFDIVYDTVGGTTLDASFVAVKRYTGHVLSCLGWGTHALAPLSFRGATYSGVFTLLPLLTGEGRLHHGEILAEAAKLAEQNKLRPLRHERTFSTSELEEAYSVVEAGSLGKVVVSI